MKRIIAAVLTVAVLFALVPSALAEKNMGMMSSVFIVYLRMFLESLDLPTWLTVEEGDLEKDHLIVPIAPNFTLSIDQSEGMMTGLAISCTASDKNYTMRDATCLMGCVMGSLMLLNEGMDGDTALEYAERLFNGWPVTINGIQYYYYKTSFFGDMRRFEVTML